MVLWGNKNGSSMAPLQKNKTKKPQLHWRGIQDLSFSVMSMRWQLHYPAAASLKGICCFKCKWKANDRMTLQWYVACRRCVMTGLRLCVLCRPWMVLSWSCLQMLLSSTPRPPFTTWVSIRWTLKLLKIIDLNVAQTQLTHANVLLTVWRGSSERVWSDPCRGPCQVQMPVALCLCPRVQHWWLVSVRDLHCNYTWCLSVWRNALKLKKKKNLAFR